MSASHICTPIHSSKPATAISSAVSVFFACQFPKILRLVDILYVLECGEGISAVLALAQIYRSQPLVMSLVMPLTESSEPLRCVVTLRITHQRTVDNISHSYIQVVEVVRRHHQSSRHLLPDNNSSSNSSIAVIIEFLSKINLLR